MTVYALYLENVLSLCFCSSCILYCSCINIHHVFCAQSMLHTVLKENESYFLDHLFFFLDHFFMSFVRITTENSENLKHEHGVICFLSCWYYGGSCFYWCMCHMFFMAHAAEVKDERFFSTILHAFPLSCPNHTTSCELMRSWVHPPSQLSDVHITQNFYSASGHCLAELTTCGTHGGWCSTLEPSGHFIKA